MTTYAHRRIAETLVVLDKVPNETAAFDEWIRARQHLDYLQKNAKCDELIIYACGPHTFIYSIAVPSDALASEDLAGC